MLLKSRRLFSVANPGPLGTTWQPTASTASGRAGPSTTGSTIVGVRSSPVSLNQSVAKTTFSCRTTGPSRRIISSTHSRPSSWFLGLS